MLIIKVWCLPNIEEEKLRNIHRDIVEAVKSVAIIGVKSEEDMTTLFPKDMMEYGLGKDIFIEMLASKRMSGGSSDIKGPLTEKVGKAMKNHFPDAKVVCHFMATRSNEHWEDTQWWVVNM